MNSIDGAEAALRKAAEAWHSSGGPSGGDGTYVKWPVPGGYSLKGGTLGLPAGEFVVWVAAAAGSGVLGSAAYDGLKLLVAHVRNRVVTDAPMLRRGDVELLVRLAVRVALINNGLAAEREVEVVSTEWTGGGHWRVVARDRHGVFRLRVQDRRPEDVMVFGQSAGPADE